jgi:hypothetical protein
MGAGAKAAMLKVRTGLAIEIALPQGTQIAKRRRKKL